MRVTELVSSAIYKSLGNRNDDPTIGQYQQVAVEILKGIVDINRNNVPFDKTFQFNTYASLQAKSFSYVGGVRYFLGKVSYLLREASLAEFKAKSYIDNLVSPPEMYYFDSLTGVIDLYPLPSDGHIIEVWGQDQTISLGGTTVLTDLYPRFYLDFLIYELAYRLCVEYNAPWDEKKEALRMDLTRKVENLGRKDIRMSLPSNISSSHGDHPFPWFYYLANRSNK